MTLLESIAGPRDVKQLDAGQLPVLASEIRDLLVETVSRTSGHLGPNLGVVELTIALHRVFDSPVDKIVFDTGHQSYVHKLLTGRVGEFGSLRQRGGLSGYPSRAESEHDLVENSHASTSLSYADGLAKAYRLRGETDRTVVAVIGDGALTGGMAWEALNNIAVAKDSRLVVVVNDNGRSYQPTIGGLANNLASLRVNQRYENVLDYIKTTLTRTPGRRRPAVRDPARDEEGPQGRAAAAGAVRGPGPEVPRPDRRPRRAGGRGTRCAGPATSAARCWCMSSPGRASATSWPRTTRRTACTRCPPPPRGHRARGGQAHLVGGVRRGAGRDRRAAAGRGGDHRRDAAPDALAPFAQAYPDRVFDVGIAEQHAVTSAAGLAMGGLHPVVAIYATFLNRAFDQVLMDVALHRLPVTFVLDRAGVTGPDGASHNGMWDGSILQVVPGLRIAAPRDATRIAELLNEAVAVSDGPTVVRFPKGNVGAEAEPVARAGSMDMLRQPEAAPPRTSCWPGPARWRSAA